VLEAAARNSVAARSPHVVATVAAALAGPDAALSRQARELTLRVSALANDPAIAPLLAATSRTRSDPARGAAGASPGTGSGSPDYAYFVERVMPILAKPGSDGAACAGCHSTHTIFRLHAPPVGRPFSEAELGDNYRAALRVVDVEHPENSLLLRKPLSSAEVEGTVSGRLAHGGGVRWSGPDHPDFRTLLDWIRGAKTPARSSP
jgi:hypothetical protein